MAVITISREYGSLGDEIADRVCELLGYRYFDKQLMAQVASEMGLSETEVVDFSEDEYRVRSFLERLFGRRRARTATEDGALPDDTADAREGTVTHLDEASFVRMVRSTVKAAYEQGNVVIVGRGGQVILEDMAGVLHVRVTAPLELRINRVRYKEFSSLATDFQQRAAEERVAERDEAAADYLRRFYDVDWTDPKLYHLVIDTQKWGPKAAACLVASAVNCL